MQANITTRVTINADPNVVFRYLYDTRFHHLWNPHLQTVKPLGKLKKDQAYEVEILILGVRTKAENRVLTCELGQEFEVENNTGMLHYLVNYQLKRLDDTTQLVCTTTVSANSRAFAFTKPVLELLARRELQSDLQALKLAAEQKLK